MRGWRTRSAARLAGASGALLLVGISAAAASGPTDSLQSQLKGVQARTHHALLDLYALDTRLRAAQTQLTSLHAQAARLGREQALLGQELSATERTLAVSQHQLGTNLRLLYKQGDVSALAVVLGASSLDEAVSKLDALSSFADESQKVVEATSAAQLRLARLRSSLADRRALIDTATRDAERTAAASVTAVPRSLASSLSPAISGALLSTSFLGLPLVLCGVLKIVYDIALLFSFRHMKAPEERKESG